VEGAVRMLRIHARGQQVSAEHGFDENAIAHTGKYDVRVDAGNPPYDERVRLMIMYIAA